MSSDQFQRAVGAALRYHAGQVRKGSSIPYFSHLLQVAGLVLEFGGDQDEAIAGLLHDAAEDAGGEATLAEIEAEFGPKVAGIVRENSDSITESKEAKAPWRERKEKYIAAISHKSESGCLVSICDKIHNARSLLADQREQGDRHWNRFNATKLDSLWNYGQLARAFEGRAIEFPRLHRPAHELTRVVTDLAAA